MDVQPVLQWQAVQEGAGIRILIRPDREGFDAEGLACTIQQALEQHGTAAVPVWVEAVAVIPKAPSGKTPLIRAAAY
jgi:hypothetical protein